MSVGARIGARVGVRVGARIGSSPGSTATTTTTQTVTVADSADPVITGGDALAYTVQYTNTGSIDATTVSVVVTLDSSLTYSSSSGSGWTIGVAGQVVTCTRASAAPGAAPAITINVTTGGSALTATTSAQATASNASTANGSQDTTVQLVTKDATLGWYLPASTTEWTNFIARKGLSIAVPTSIWNCQEASGDLVDSGSGGITLTATAGGLAYQQTDAGLTRKIVTFTDAGTGGFKSTSASLPDISTTDCTTMFLLKVTNPAAVRNVLGQGTTVSKLGATNSNKMRVTSGANTLDSTGTVTAAWKPWTVTTAHGSSTTGFTDTEKVAPVFGSPTGKTTFLGANGASSPTMGAAYGFQIPSTVTAANLKACLQAMGATITWT